MSYAKAIPIDNMRSPMQDNPPALKALQTFGVANVASSSVITFHDNATNLEVTAGNSPIVLRWVPVSDTAASVVAYGATANFDHGVATNQTRKFVIPKETNNVASIVGLNIQYGLYRRVAWVTAGVSSSVLATTY